jgi:hypothetical protein
MHGHFLPNYDSEIRRIGALRPTFPPSLCYLGSRPMPMTYRIDLDANLLFVVMSGVLTPAERMHTMLAWINDPDFRPGLDTFCDLTESKSTPDLAELREIVATISEHAPRIGPKKVAMLTSRPITFGVARVFEALAEVEDTPLQVKVFNDRSAAWAWLRPGDSDQVDLSRTP